MICARDAENPYFEMSKKNTSHVLRYFSRNRLRTSDRKHTAARRNYTKYPKSPNKDHSGSKLVAGGSMFCFVMDKTMEWDG
jgi:hypothetical protein